MHADDPRLRRLAVLDAVINNADRKGGHLLPAPDGRLYGIDHGVTFNTEDKLRTLLWGWAGEPLTAEAVDVLAGLGGRAGDGALADAAGGADHRRPRWTRCAGRVARAAGDRRAPGARAGSGRPSRGRRCERAGPAAARARAAGPSGPQRGVRRKTALPATGSRSGSYTEHPSGYAHDMHAWPASEVPALPGKGRDLRIHDTATGGLVTLDPGPVARIYVCGITPYDATHMGHAATYNAFDLVQRVWLDTKRQVHYVQNVTDVDDPLLERAVRDGEDWTELAERETALFREDMTALRMLPPQHYIGAVEAIPGIVPLVERLRDAGAAYELDGDVYFSVEADPHFGKVSDLDADAMRLLSAERGGDPERPGKKNPLDPMLWMAAREGEPSWDGGSLGPGRPGWHIECVAIALDHLGMGFDVQGGGSDLVFPHHEMGASHAQVLTGEYPFAKAYVHAGMVALRRREDVQVQGQPGLRVRAAPRRRRPGGDPAGAARPPLPGRLGVDRPGARRGRRARSARWRAAVSRPDGPSADALVEEIREALADDLDAPAALAAVDRWADAQTRRRAARTRARPASSRVPSTPCWASRSDRL